MFEKEQQKDTKEMRTEFKKMLDKYKVSNADKNKLLTLSAHMDKAEF